MTAIRKHGFHLISRFRDNAHLCYLYEGERSGNRGRPKMIDGKIDLKTLHSQARMYWTFTGQGSR